MATSRGLTVLIVDDEPLFRELFAQVIARRYPEVQIVEAEDLDGARARIRAQRPDIAFIDIGLPDGSGLALVEELRRGGSGAIIAVCTSYDLPEYREAAKRSGASCFLAKSGLRADDIAAVVGRAVHPEEHSAAWCGDDLAEDGLAEIGPHGPATER